MHKTPFTHASRIFSALAAALALLLLSGCEMAINDMTPDKIPANPSQIYTVTATFAPKSRNVIEETIQPRIIIDGESHNMTRNSAGRDVWEFEYQLPAGRSGASYYFIVDYELKGASGNTPRELYSALRTISIVGRYVLRPEATRAPVGSRVSVLGAGFTPSDVVYFDSTPTRTVFESPSSLSFFVPAVEPGRSYNLRVDGGGAGLAVGAFRVDGLNFTVSPSELVLRTGEQQAVTFTLPSPAPAGGMLIDVTTDVAASIIMPEVMVPAGQLSVTIPVQGGKPGQGAIYFKSSAGESSIPVTVSAK